MFPEDIVRDEYVRTLQKFRFYFPLGSHNARFFQHIHVGFQHNYHPHQLVCWVRIFRSCGH